MSYTYLSPTSSPTRRHEVGQITSIGTWEHESDHSSALAAASRVVQLNATSSATDPANDGDKAE